MFNAHRASLRYLLVSCLLITLGGCLPAPRPADVGNTADTSTLADTTIADATPSCDSKTEISVKGKVVQFASVNGGWSLQQLTQVSDRMFIAVAEADDLLTETCQKALGMSVTATLLTSLKDGTDVTSGILAHYSDCKFIKGNLGGESTFDFDVDAQLHPGQLALLVFSLKAPDTLDSLPKVKEWLQTEPEVHPTVNLIPGYNATARCDRVNLNALAIMKDSWPALADTYLKIEKASGATMMVMLKSDGATLDSTNSFWANKDDAKLSNTYPVTLNGTLFTVDAKNEKSSTGLLLIPHNTAQGAWGPDYFAERDDNTKSVSDWSGSAYGGFVISYWTF